MSKENHCVFESYMEFYVNIFVEVIQLPWENELISIICDEASLHG